MMHHADSALLLLLLLAVATFGLLRRLGLFGGFTTGLWSGFFTRLFQGTLRTRTGSGCLESGLKALAWIVVLLFVLAVLG